MIEQMIYALNKVQKILWLTNIMHIKL